VALHFPVSPHLPFSPSPRLSLSPSRALLFALVVLSLTGCHSTRKKVIGVVPKATSHLFWVSIHSGDMAAGHDLGVEILWIGPAS
jgi:ABC-type sugar transport system substrate-binding protein